MIMNRYYNVIVVNYTYIINSTIIIFKSLKLIQKKDNGISDIIN